MASTNRAIARRALLAIAFILHVVGSESPRAADKVRISYTAPGPQHGILWIADVSGLFKRNNIDVEVIYMPGNISAPSLMAGEVQFAQMTGALMSPVRLQGGDPVMLLSIQELLDDRLLARPNITKPEELRGQTHRDFPLWRGISHASAQYVAPFRSQRKGRDVFTDRRHPGADHCSGR